MSGTKTNFRILIVDDDPTTRYLLREYLENAGHHVAMAENGREGIDMLQKQPFQIAIVDWLMPVLDGLEMCRWVRANHLANTVHLVMLTAYDAQEKLIQAFDAGVDDFLSKPIREGELIARLRAWTRTIQMEHELTAQGRAAMARSEELAELNAKLKYLAAVDELTGLPNRREAMKHLEEKLGLAKRYGHSMAVAIMDIDNFKPVNDSMGHAAGDWLLRTVCARLRDNVRDVDGLFRLGGDELLALFPHQTAVAAAVGVERCRASIAGENFVYEGRSVKVTLSAGMADNEAGAQDADQLLKLADAALYTAKRRGRNGLFVHGAPGGETAAA